MPQEKSTIIIDDDDISDSESESDDSDSSDDAPPVVKRGPNWLCSICQEQNQHPMMIVKCGHSYCEECLSQVSLCPQCRAPFDRYDLQTNYALFTAKTSERKQTMDDQTVDEAVEAVLANRDRLLEFRVQQVCKSVLKVIDEKITREPLSRVVVVSVPYNSRGVIAEAKRLLQQKGFQVRVTECLTTNHIFDNHLLTVTLPEFGSKNRDDDVDFFATVVV
jgi:hypothetical protein